MIEVQRIAGAGHVLIEARIGVEPVIGRIVDAAKRQRRAEVVALAAVVIDDIEKNFDPGIVQPPDHGLETGDRLGRQQARVGGKKGDGVVAPVIDQPAIDQLAVVDRGMHRQELDRGDAEPDEVVDHRRRGEAGKGAAMLGSNAGMALGNAAHVELENDRPFPRGLRPIFLAPGKRRLHDPAFGNEAGVVAPVDRQILARAAEAVAEIGIGPAQPAVQRPGVGVNQEFVGVEAVPIGRVVGAMDAIAIKLVGAPVGQIDVPDLVGIFGKLDPRFLANSGAVEQTQLDLLRMRREQREIHPLAVPGGAQRIGAARPDLCR